MNSPRIHCNIVTRLHKGAVFGGVALALLLASTPARAQEARGNIEGTVYNATNDSPIGRAKVTVSETGREVLTDNYGRYYFPGMPPGDYQLNVTYIGFAPQSKTITVTAGGTAVADFQLDIEGVSRRPATAAKGDEIVQLERFTVVSDQVMSAQAIAMNEQRYASTIKNIVAFEELGEQGLDNIGNFMRFLPGVTIMEGDADNPSTMGLGGFPAEMTSIQLDGAEIASAGLGIGSTRAVSLSDVPMGSIERIEVTKVPTPDMPASGLGGSVNLVTKNSFGSKTPSFNYRAYMNFNNRDGLTFDGGPRQGTPATSPKYMQPSFEASFIMPVNKWFAFNVSAGRTWTKLPDDGVVMENANWRLRSVVTGTAADDTPIIAPPALYQALWNKDAGIRTTENLQLGVDIKMSQMDILTLKVQRRDTSQATSRYTTVARFQSGTGVNTGDGSYAQSQLNNGTLEMNSRNNLETNNKAVEAGLKYEHIGPSWRFKAQGSFSTAEKVQTNLGNGTFNTVTTRIQRLNLRGEGIDEGDSILPNTYIVTTGTEGIPMEDAVDIYDLNNYTWSGANSVDGRYKTDLFTGALDVERIFGRSFSVKAGVAYRRLEKDDRRRDENYTLSGAPATLIPDYGIASGPLVDMNGRQITWINPTRAYDVFLEHPEWFSLNSTAYQYEAQNSRRMLEAVSAGYFMFNLKLFENRMNIVAGVRYEKTEIDGWSMKQDKFAIYKRNEDGNLVLDANDQPIVAVTDGTEQNKLIYKVRALHESQKYDDFYPSININYAITPNIVARAAYARTIGRPDVKYVVSGIQVPNLSDSFDVDENGDPTTTRSVVVGNPGLKPWTSDSFHLSLGAYHAKGGFGSIGVYRKRVQNFFIWKSRPATREVLEYYGIPDGDIDVMLEQEYHLRRYENIFDANLTGLELSYRQDLFFLPSWLQKMQVWVNYTYLAISGPGAKEFLGFTPRVFSWGLNYIRPRYSVRIDCAYQAETKHTLDYTVGTSSVNFYPPGTYTYQNSYIRWGLTAEYALAKEISLFVNWNNIFGKDRYRNRRGAEYPPYGSLVYRNETPTTIMVGIKGRF